MGFAIATKRFNCVDDNIDINVNYVPLEVPHRAFFHENPP